MVYTGWLDLGGREIVNAGRTYKYVSMLLPNLHVEPCSGCEDLFEALGHKEYTSPLVDQPSWFDPDNPDTWDFYGLYPLSMEGFEDATTQAAVTQFIYDGGAVSPPRRATRSMRVTGLLVGQTSAAVSAGMVWLRKALRPGTCGSGSSCAGDHLSYFSSCPPLCEDSPDLLSELLGGTSYTDASASTFVDPGFDTGVGGRVTTGGTSTIIAGGAPVLTKNLMTNPSMETAGTANGQTVRTNLVWTPRVAATFAGWNYVAGTSETGTSTQVTAASDGPILPDGSMCATYMRRTVTVAKTAGSTGWQIGGTSTIPVTIAAGDQYSASMWIRSSVAITLGGFRLTARLATASVGFVDSPSVTLVPNAWTQLSVAMTPSTVTGPGDNLMVWPTLLAASVLPAGATMDVTALCVERAPIVRPYFDGVSRPPLRTNYVTNPRGVTGGASWNTNNTGGFTAPATTSLPITQSIIPSVTTAYRRTVTAGPATGFFANTPHSSTSALTGTSPVWPVRPGETVSAGMLVRATLAQGFSVNIGWRDAANAFISWSAGVAVVGDGQWHWQTAQGTAPANAAYAYIVATSLSVPQVYPYTLDTTAAIATFGTLTPLTPGDFFDGATAASVNEAPAWGGTANASRSAAHDPDLNVAWSGTAHASTSVFRGTAPANVVAANNASVRSGRWAASGANSLRIIPAPTVTGTEALNSLAYVGGNSSSSMNAGMLPGHTYTLIATCRLNAAQTGTPWTYARQMVVNHHNVTGLTGGKAVVSTAAPNAAGVTQLRLTFTLPADTVWAQIRLYNGASVGNGDVWWDNVALVEGDYRGPYFDGSSPTITAPYGTVTHAWDGTAHASTSTATQTVESSMLQVTPTPGALYGSVMLAPDAFDATGNEPLAWAAIPATSGQGVWAYGARVWAPVGVQVDLRPVLFTGPWASAGTPAAQPVPVGFVGDGTWHTLESVFSPQVVANWVGIQVSTPYPVEASSLILVDDVMVRAPAVSGQPRECETGAIMSPLTLCAAPYERHLYEAVCVDGPRIVQEFDPVCGAMAQVEFTIVAGVPSPFGTARQIANVAADPASMTTYTDVACIPPGAPVVERFQLVPNPGPTLALGWLSPSPSYWTNVRSTTGPHTTGGASVISTRTATGGPEPTFLGAATLIGAYGGDHLSATQVRAGVTYTASLWMRGSAASIARLQVQGMGATGSVVGPQFTGSTAAAASTWVRVAVTFTAASGTTSVKLSASMQASSGNAVVGAQARFAEALVESGNRIGVYFDGSGTSSNVAIDFEWLAAVGKSASKMSETILAAPIIDPDCPPIPAPPRPPVIDEGCIDTLSTYKRMMVTIPASAVPEWSDVVPIVNLTAGPTAVRQLRVRFYPNPSGAPVEQLSVCKYVGEFIVSYLPPNSTMTIDGTSHDVVVTSASGATQKADHLLYGTGGGPMVWPFMSCGSRYDLAVDVDPAGANVGFELCVAARE